MSGRVGPFGAQRSCSVSCSAAEQRRTVASQNERLLQQSRRLAEAQHVAQLGYWEIDSATGDVFWSDEMYRLVGLPVGERPVPTEQFIARIHAGDRERMQAVATAAITQFTEFTEQYRTVIPDGPTRFVQATGRIITDELGALKLIGTVQDISERVDLESRLRHIQKLDAIGKLAGGLAHDFNNLLTVIDGCVGLLAANPNDPDRDEFLAEIRDAGRRGSAMTRQLLAFSRQQVLQPRVFDLNETVRGLTPMLRRLIDERISFETKLDAADAQIRADPGQIEQVLLNLVVNARDAMPSGGKLRIETANVTLDEIEDDRSVRVTASAVLRRAGYKILEATNGNEALAVCRDPQHHLDLVLTDVVMPNMGGRELAAALRTESPDLPVILMSGYTRDASILSGEPGLAFLEKPFTSESLTHRVREALDTARGART